MRTSLIIAGMMSLPGVNLLLAQAQIGNPWLETGLNVGGMGILGYLLYLQMTKVGPKQIEVISERHKEGLVAVATQVEGLREDMKEQADEQNFILKQAISLSQRRTELGS